MNKRLFVSIPIPEFLKEAFDRYRGLYPLKHIRWLPKENFHITVFFIGDTEEENISFISEKLKKISKGLKPFSLEFSNVCFAPPGKSKRMVWGVFSMSDFFQDMVDRVSKSLDDSYDAKARPAIPHVTIARLKYSKSLKNINFKQPDLKNKTLEVCSLELQESHLMPGGAFYKVIEVFPFKKEGST